MKKVFTLTRHYDGGLFIDELSDSIFKSLAAGRAISVIPDSPHICPRGLRRFFDVGETERLELVTSDEPFAEALRVKMPTLLWYVGAQLLIDYEDGCVVLEQARITRPVSEFIAELWGYDSWFYVGFNILED